MSIPPAASAAPAGGRRGPSVPLPGFLRTLVDNRSLIWELAQRDLIRRTRGAALGLTWWLLSPLLLLGAYAFAFAYILGVRWGVDPGEAGGAGAFTLRLFAGLIVYQFFSEIIGLASGMIVGNEQYVKRIVFPVQILPAVTLTVAAFGWGFSFIALLVMCFFLEGPPAWTAIFAPIVMLPVAFCALGAAWFVAAIGVFVRDTRNIVQILVLALMFLSPVFYPIERIEGFFPAVQWVHPLATVMEQLRACVFDPSALGHPAWFSVLGISLVVAWIGYAVFNKLRPAFADVL